jgi:hypothetical protein
MPSQKLLDALNYQYRVNALVIAHPSHDPHGPALMPDELKAMQGAYDDGMPAETFAALMLQMRELAPQGVPVGPGTFPGLTIREIEGHRTLPESDGETSERRAMREAGRLHLLQDDR